MEELSGKKMDIEGKREKERSRKQLMRANRSEEEKDKARSKDRELKQLQRAKETEEEKSKRLAKA